MTEKNNTRGMPKYEIYVAHKVFQDGKFRVTDLVELSVLERQQEITRQLCEESNRLFGDRATLQQKLDAMAAENAALRDVLEDIVEPQSSVLEREHRIRAENALKAQATNAYLNSVRAEGVDMVAEAIGNSAAKLKAGSKDWKSLKSIVFTLVNFAAQLRSGTHDTADKAG